MDACIGWQPSWPYGAHAAYGSSKAPQAGSFDESEEREKASCIFVQWHFGPPRRRDEESISNGASLFDVYLTIWMKTIYSLSRLLIPRWRNLGLEVRSAVAYDLFERLTLFSRRYGLPDNPSIPTRRRYCRPSCTVCAGLPAYVICHLLSHYQKYQLFHFRMGARNCKRRQTRSTRRRPSESEVKSSIDDFFFKKLDLLGHLEYIP